jgi:hypothetical protein
MSEKANWISQAFEKAKKKERRTWSKCEPTPGYTIPFMNMNIGRGLGGK